MKKLLACLALAAAILSAGANWAEEKYPYDVTIRELYSAPDETANVVYRIPIEVRMLDISEDCNWYKVKVAFSLGPLVYSYIGWTKIPVGEALASRDPYFAKDQSAPVLTSK